MMFEAGNSSTVVRTRSLKNTIQYCDTVCQNQPADLENTMFSPLQPLYIELAHERDFVDPVHRET